MANAIGTITVNSKDILEVDADPSAGGGTPASIGSLAMWDSGTVGRVYIKVGAADTAWSQLDSAEGDDWNLDGNDLTGGTPTTPTEFFGSNNNYDVVFNRNSAELMRLVSDGLLVGLNATLGGRLQVGVAALGDELFKMSSPNGGSGARVIHVVRQYKVQTTNATPGVLASIAIPATTRVNIYAKVACNQHAGSAGANGDGADYHRTYSAKRLAAGNAILNKSQTDFTAEDVNAFNVTPSVNVNNIDLTVDGALNRSLAWSAHVELFIAQD